MIKVDAKSAALLKSLTLVPGHRYEGITITPVSLTTQEREWVDGNRVARKGERPVISFESAIGPVSCYVFREENEPLPDAMLRVLRHLGLDPDPMKWTPVTTTITVSRHRTLIVETPRPAKADAKSSDGVNGTLAALGL